MNKYKSVCLEIYERCNLGLITPYEREILLESATDRMYQKIGNSAKLITINKLVKYLQNEAFEVDTEVRKLSKTWNYKEAIKKLEGLQKNILTVKSKINKEKVNIGDEKLSGAVEKVSNLEQKTNRDIKELRLKNKKKNLNRFNNKYWIDYTKKHNQAFQDVEKELLGYNTKAGKNHDMDKYIMYHFLPAPIAHALHTKFARHHKRRARTEEDYRNMIIDIECARRTKPDKQMKPYEVIDKFYPELKETMDPILQKYGLPRNAKEDREMEQRKKSGLGKKKLI